MGQNQNRPPRDTSVDAHKRRQAERRDPKGQDKALRAMEMFAQDTINPGQEEDEGPPPGSDLYYQLLERAGVPMTDEILDYLNQNEIPFRDVIQKYGDKQDDEFYPQDFSTETVERIGKTEPWVIKNVNDITGRDAEAGIPHRGYDVWMDTPINHGSQYDKESRYLSTDTTDANDLKFRTLLQMMLGKGQR